MLCESGFVFYSDSLSILPRRKIVIDALSVRVRTARRSGASFSSLFLIKLRETDESFADTTAGRTLVALL